MQRRTKRKRKKSKAPMLLGLLLLVLCLGVGGVIAYPTVKKFLAPSPSSQTTKASSEKEPLPKTSVAPKPAKPATPAWLTAKAANQLPILMFHYVSSQASDLTDSNWMPAATFEADLKALKAAGYTTVTAAEAEKILTTNTKPSNKMVWLTFDDGSLTMERDVEPLLKKYDMHATANIITDFVDKGQGGILTWDNIKSMQASGNWDFGSHTVDHKDLSTQTAAEQTSELKQSKTELEQKLGQSLNLICYPAGGYNADTLAVAGQAGYKFGLLDPGRNGAVAKAAAASDGLLTLPRLRMSSDTGPDALMQMLAPAEAYNKAN